MQTQTSSQLNKKMSIGFFAAHLLLAGTAVLFFSTSKQLRIIGWFNVAEAIFVGTELLLWISGFAFAYFLRGRFLYWIFTCAIGLLIVWFKLKHSFAFGMLS